MLTYNCKLSTKQIREQLEIKYNQIKANVSRETKGEK